MRFSLSNNNRNDLKTYVYKQTTASLQVLSVERKDKIKLSLAIISIKCYVPGRDNNKNDLQTYIYW